MPNGTRAYVTELGGAVAVIDTATNTLLSTITIPNVQVSPQFSQAPLPMGIAITPDGTKAYVADLYGDAVSVLDTTTNTLVATIPTAGSAIGVAISGDGTKAYATNVFIQFCTVTVIDTTTNTAVTAIPVGGNPFAVAITPTPSTAALIANLADTVNSLNLQVGIANSLDAKLNAVQAALAAAQANNVTTACNEMNAFVNAVMAQSGKKLTEAEANQLIAMANLVTASLDCSQ